MLSLSSIVAILAGTVLLVFGRRLFWLAVAILGFLVALEFARELAVGQPQWAVWAIGIGAGLVGAVAAIFLQRIAFGLAGLYGGAYLALFAVHSLGWPITELLVLLFGGAIGAVAGVLLTDWAIIGLTSLIGAGLIVGTLALDPVIGAVVAAALAAAGMVIQGRALRGSGVPPSDAPLR